MLIEVIPSLELVLGEQPAVAPVPPREAKNRLNLLLRRLLAALAAPEHPLVLFLDDLQWADAASLDFLQRLLLDEAVGDFLLIGAFRDNEVEASAPLLVTISEIEREHGAIESIALGNLSRDDVEALAAEALSCEPRECRELAELVYEKTRGNAFFTTEFLHSLYHEGLLRLERPAAGGGRGGWRFDMAKIRAKNITDNVVELMAVRIGELRAATQAAVKLAACLGSPFELAMLALVHGDATSQTATLKALWPAVEAGLVIPLDDHYQAVRDGRGEPQAAAFFKFSHDRVRQAAYSLIAEAEKGKVHLRIGRRLAQDGEVTDEHLFAVVQQLNRALGEIHAAAERRELAALNLRAGRKARKSTAYGLAMSYLEVGVSLLAEEAWSSHYRLAFDLHLELAEAAYLATRFDDAERLYPRLLEKARTEEDRFEAGFAQLSHLQVQGRYAEMIPMGRVALKLLGVELPERREELQALFETELATCRELLAGRRIADLVDAPEMTDAGKTRLMRLLAELAGGSHFADRQVHLWTQVKRVSLSLEHGWHENSAIAYSAFGAIVAVGILRDYDLAFELGRLAIERSQRYQSPAARARASFGYGGAIHHWLRPLASALPYLRDAHRWGVEGGDLAFAAYSVHFQLAKMPLVEEYMVWQADRPDACFFAALALAAAHDAAPADEKKSHEERLDEYLARMAGWAERCAANFEHRRLLLEAERARIAEKPLCAMDFYRRGIAAAKDNDYPHHEALGQELYARFWLARGEPDYARVHLLRALSLYAVWGATAKVLDLETKYRQVLGERRAEAAASHATTVSGPIDFDLDTLMKALRAISSEIHLGQLLETMIRIVVTNAGAQRGCLILEKGDEPLAAVTALPGEDGVLVHRREAKAWHEDVAVAVVRYVRRTGRELVLDDASSDERFASDPYVREHRVRSLLAIPILRETEMTGILYLENNLMSRAFTEERMELLHLLFAQAAISLENAFLYAERGRVEAALRAHAAELEVKNAELERFTYTISHELKTPLFTIQGFLGLLARDVAAGNTLGTEADMQRIRRAATIMQKQLDELLKLSRIGHSENQESPAEELALEKLAGDAAGLLAPLLAERRVEVELATDLPAVFGDRLRLLEVLQILIENAARFMGEQVEPRIEIGAERRGEQVACYVRDNGIGIEPRYHERIFNLFERLDPEVDGTGVGLALARRIVEVQGGRLWVESAGPGQGSTFWLTLRAPEGAAMP